MNERPKKGQTMIVRGVVCRIVKVYPFGTVDVVSEDGHHAWRVTGLGFL
jgi:hypothetical protein